MHSTCLVLSIERTRVQSFGDRPRRCPRPPPVGGPEGLTLGSSSAGVLDRFPFACLRTAFVAAGKFGGAVPVGLGRRSVVVGGPVRVVRDARSGNQSDAVCLTFHCWALHVTVLHCLFSSRFVLQPLSGPESWSPRRGLAILNQSAAKLAARSVLCFARVSVAVSRAIYLHIHAFSGYLVVPYARASSLCAA